MGAGSWLMYVYKNKAKTHTHTHTHTHWVPPSLPPSLSFSHKHTHTHTTHTHHTHTPQTHTHTHIKSNRAELVRVIQVEETSLQSGLESSDCCSISNVWRQLFQTEGPTWEKAHFILYLYSRSFRRQVSSLEWRGRAEQRWRISET